MQTYQLIQLEWIKHIIPHYFLRSKAECFKIQTSITWVI
ncbi:hypothetical protein FM106_03475 [Brachybacterium faecium]|nr:hypothetical protein FM106_03475 [Brachybacterium faecium]